MILLGNRIRELRTEYSLTQAELAKKVGVSKATITAYENDSRQPSYEVLIKLARVFKVSIDSIILNRSEYIIDVSDLNPMQINKVENLVSYFKKSDLIDAFCEKELTYNEIKNLMNKYPGVFKVFNTVCDLENNNIIDNDIDKIRNKNVGWNCVPETVKNFV